MTEWFPNEIIFEEYVTLIRGSVGDSKSRHNDIFEKLDFSKNSDIPNYLLSILNDKRLNEDIRQVSGLALKGFVERSSADMGASEHDYFKSHIFLSILDHNVSIQKTISGLICTYLQIGGIELWPDILDILLKCLQNRITIPVSLEILNMIIEDSGAVIENKHFDFVENLAQELLAFVHSCDYPESAECNSLMLQILTSMYIILENCPDGIYDTINDVHECLIKLMNLNKSILNSEMRYRIGRCWLGVMIIKPQIVECIAPQLVIFFTENLLIENYQLNFTSAEFFLRVVDNANGFMRNPKLRNALENKLKTLLPLLLHFTKLTRLDFSAKIDTDARKKNSHLNAELEESLVNEEILEQNWESYNLNWTLRKCCSRLIDSLSNTFPEVVIDTLRPFLETELQSSDWKTLESSILVLGAIGIGSYEYLKPDLGKLIQHIITQLSHNIKFIRATSCWALSRFTSFIMECDNNLLSLYLCELLQRMTDKESIVQNSSCAALNCLVTSECNQKLLPYIEKIFKILSFIFVQYEGNNMISVYETITVLCENFPEQFTNRELCSELLISILARWYEVTAIDHSKKCHNVVLLSQNLALFDLLSAVIKVTSCLKGGYCNEIFSVSLELIELQINEKDIVAKSVDLISTLCQVFPEQVKLNPKTSRLIDIICRVIEVHHLQNILDSVYLKQNIIVLIGDLCKVESCLLTPHIDYFIQFLLSNLRFSNHRRSEKLSLCSNSCWSLGLITIAFPEKIQNFSTMIMERLVKILTKRKLNITLAQNISICIGKLGIVYPETVSKYLSKFMKQFSLTVKTMENSNEKHDAFLGMYKAIISNPGGILDKNLFYFLDALCENIDGHSMLGELFDRIVLSFKEVLNDSWNALYISFPPHLQKIISSRILDKYEVKL